MALSVVADGHLQKQEVLWVGILEIHHQALINSTDFHTHPITEYLIVCCHTRQGERHDGLFNNPQEGELKMDKLVFVIGKIRRTRDVDLNRAKQLALGWKTKGVSEIKIYALSPYSETEAYVPEETIEAALKTEPLAVVRPTYDCEKEEEPKQFGRRGFDLKQDMMR